MKAAKFTCGLVAIFLLPPALGQDGFQKAHQLFTEYWTDSFHAKISDIAEMKRLRAWAPDLPEQMERLLNPAILRFLNSTPNPSPETLKDDLSKALTVPGVGGKTAAEDVADAVSVDGDRIFFVAYGVSNCASCSKTCTTNPMKAAEEESAVALQLAAPPLTAAPPHARPSDQPALSASCHSDDAAPSQALVIPTRPPQRPRKNPRLLSAAAPRSTTVGALP